MVEFTRTETDATFPATGEGEGLLPSAGIVAVMTAMGCAALPAATRRD